MLVPTANLTNPGTRSGTSTRSTIVVVPVAIGLTYRGSSSICTVYIGENCIASGAMQNSSEKSCWTNIPEQHSPVPWPNAHSRRNLTMPSTTTFAERGLLTRPSKSGISFTASCSLVKHDQTVHMPTMSRAKQSVSRPHAFQSKTQWRYWVKCLNHV